MNDRAQIRVRQMTSYADRLRAYKVKINGVVLGSVRAGDSVTIPVSPGRHSLVIRINWCGSPEIGFDAYPSEPVIFECGSSLAGWRVLLALFYVIFRTHKYLWLRRAG